MDCSARERTNSNTKPLVVSLHIPDIPDPNSQLSDLFQSFRDVKYLRLERLTGFVGEGGMSMFVSHYEALAGAYFPFLSHGSCQ